MMDEDALQRPLRKGWTTGTCAAAAAAAAYRRCDRRAFPEQVSVLLPRGREAKR